jgi:signal transduction histidine kinase
MRATEGSARQQRKDTPLRTSHPKRHRGVSREIDQWREQVLGWIAGATAALALPCVVFVFWAIAERGFPWYAGAPYPLILGLVVWVALARRRPYRLRALAFLGIFFFSQAYTVVALGAIRASLGLTTFVALSALLLGMRSSYVAAGLSFAALLLGGVLHTQGLIATVPLLSPELPRPWVAMSLNMLFQCGLLICAAGFLVTKLERNIEELEQRVEERTISLQVANEELESYSRSVSHDLRAPLRHILGYLEALEEDSPTALGPGGRDYLARIRSTVSRMNVLIDSLLAFSRAGRAALEVRLVDLQPLVHGVVEEAKEGTAGREIIWVMGKLPRVHGDAALLRQVFCNLIENAVKYTKKQPAPRIEIRWEQRGNVDVFSVADNGVGFDPQYADKLFGVFQRLHSEKDFEGAGIGLANVRRIVGRHGGRCWASGMPGRGATFSFSLPRPRNAMDDGPGAYAI